MKNIIYYFTGTGNSLSVAKNLAKMIDGETELRAITNYLAQDEVIVNAEETVGFVFPIYGSDAPWPVKAVAEKMNIQNDPYIYAIGTCNERGGCCMDLFGGLMKRHGYKVSYAKKIDMPGNCMESNQGENEERLELEESRVAVFAKNINRRFVSTVENFDAPDNTSEGTRARFAGSPFVTFKADPELCIGCGVCEQICPMNNIKVVDGVAQFADECAYCFGCFHWCPQKAIGREGLTRSQYHHPAVSVDDMDEQSYRA